MTPWQKSNYYGDTIKEVLEKKINANVCSLFESPVHSFSEAKQIAERLLEIAKEKKSIYILGDYDVDGIHSSLELSLILDALSIPYKVYIPRRISDGYGVSANSLKEATKYDIIITVDNGITAAERLEEQKALGKEVIIIDHHIKRDDGKIPNVDFVFNPEVSGGDFTHYCGAGLVYKIGEELHLKNQISDEIMQTITFLAMIATVADVMPLLDENRVIVKKGLQCMNNWGYAEVNRTFQLYKNVTATNIAFSVAPAINALGRLKDDGGQMMYTILRNYFAQKQEFALSTLPDINEQRKSIQKTLTNQMLEQYKAAPAMYPNVLCLEHCPEGLVGILAGKLTEKTNKASFIFTKSGKNIKGSARSNGDLHIKQFMDKHKSLFLSYGGHQSAGGMTMTEEQYQQFLQLAIEHAQEGQKEFSYYYDMELFDAEFIPSLIDEQLSYEPFGEGIKKPIVKTTVHLTDYKIIGKGESFKGAANCFEVFGYNLAKQYQALSCPTDFEAIGTLSENWFMGKRTIQLELIDIKKIS